MIVGLKSIKLSCDHFANSNNVGFSASPLFVSLYLLSANMVGKFEFEHSYHELEINEILKNHHTFSNWSLLRLEIYERGYFNRNPSGTEYIRFS